MLTSEWKRVAVALRLLALGLLLGALSASSSAVLSGRDELIVLRYVGLGGSVLSTLGVVGFASVPKDSRGRKPALLAALFFVLECVFRIQSVDLSTTNGLPIIASLLGLFGVLAHLRALGLVGLYLRVDKIYDRASTLWVLLVLVISSVLIVSVLLYVRPDLGVVAGLTFTVVSAVSNVLFVVLVLKTASTIQTLLPR